MAKPITRTEKLIDDYINNLPDWSKEICEKLRSIIHQSSPDLSEDLKWGSPAFSYNGNLVCWFWAFSKNARLFFFEGALMKDPKKLFNSERTTKRNRSVEFTDVSQIRESVLIDYIREAIKLSKAGKHVKIPVSKDKTVAVPQHIKKILGEKGLIEQFEGQIYTYCKGYIRWIEEAKQEETKKRRIETMLSELKAGKYYMGMPH